MFTTDLFEQASRPVTVCFGRMNPPTLGHGQLLKTVSDNAGNGDYYIFATKTHKLPDNPLPYDVKFKFLQAMFPEYAEHMVYDPGLKTIMQVAQWLYDKGYTELNFVAGSDRIPEFSKLLNTYNGKGQPGDKGYYIFSKINMISAGDRDPDAEGLAGISASKARAAAEAGNFEDFVAKTGAGNLAKPLYDAVRKAQGVSEDIAPVSQDTTSPIHGKPVEEEAAGVGVVAANSKMAKDPRYSMSITKDVKPSTPKNMLRAFKLSEGPVSTIAKTIAGLTGAGTVLGVKQSQQRQQDKKEQEQLRQERIKKLDDPQAQKDFDTWFKQYEQERLNKIQSASEPLNEKWSQKQRKSVDCSNPKGFSQKAHCAGRKARKAGRKTKSGPVSESKQTELSVIPMIKKFLPIVKEELKLEKLPKIKVQRHIEVHNGQATFGRFVNNEQVIYLGIADRHPVDVLRTLAHELVHWKQFVEGRIEPDSGKTGSPIENEAHAVAGILMRHFNKKYPDAIKLNNIELQESQDYVLGNVGYSSALNPVAWENEELKPEVRDRLLKISGEFVKYLEVPGFDVLDVVLTGSMANYNWTQYSDFDLHVVTNYSDLECEDLAETFYRAKKELWNNNHDITIGGHEVEMYVEDAEKPPVSAGVYSILDNRWIKKPVYDKPEIDKSAVNAKVRDMLQQIKSAIASADSPTDIQRIKDKLRKMRRAGLDSVGEFSVENLTYKILRNMGILNKMSDIQTREQDQQLSLPESKKKINLATAQLNEKKRRKKRKARAKGGPYYGYYYGLGTASDSGVEGGDGGGVEEGELIPWPKGTVKVDVSDVYDWYKLGQHISNLKGLGKHDFGKGPPQTVMAFGSEPLEHEYIKDLNKIGLKTYDIDENVAEGNNIKILLKVNDEDSTVDVTAMLDGEEVGHVNFDDSEGELIPQDLYVDPEYRGQGIAAAMYNYTKSKGYTILRGEEQSDDAIKLWNKHRPGQDIWEQGVAEGKMAELDMDLEDPEITDRQFEKMYGMTRKEARKLFSKTNMWDFPDFRDPDKPLHEQGVTKDSVIFLNNNTVIVGQEHGKSLELSPETSKQVRAIAKKYGAWYEGNGMDKKFTKGIIDEYQGSWDDDLLSPSIKGYPYPFLYVLFSNIEANDTVKGKIGSDPKVTIFNRILDTQPSTNYFPDRTFSSEDLTKFLKSVSQGPYDFVKMSQAPATEKNVQKFFKIGEKLMWPENWEEYPNNAGQLAKRVNDLRDKFLASRKSGVYVVGSSHLIAVKNFANKQDVSESLDRPYSYHWEEGDFGDLNAYAQLSDNTVLDIEFEQINVDKSQWTVGFQRDGQIHKTGKGDEQRVFATVLSAIKEFIENKQPKEVFFSAEKSEVNPESRKRLYDRLVQKYATALGYQASQSETSRETKYKLSRIREQGVAEGNNNLNFEEGDCPIFAIALHRLSKLPLMALVEYDEEMGSTVLIHAYVKLNDEWRVDASGETNVPHMLAKFPNNGAAQEVQISEKDLIKLGYEKNKCPALSEVLPHAKEVLQDITQGVTEGSEQISINVRKGHNKFTTELSVDGKTAGVYQYDANSGRSIAEVYPEYKGKGFGKILVLHAIYTAAKLGIDFVEDESRTAEYDNVLDSLDSNGLAVNDDGYWYVTGEGEQYLKQRLKQGVAEGNLTEFAPGPDFRDDDDRQDMPLLEFAEIIKLFLGSEYTMIDRKTPEQVSVKFDPKDRTSGHNGAVLYSLIGKKQNEYPTVNFQLIDYEQGPQVGRGRRAGTAILKTRSNALKIADIIYNTMGLPQQDRRVEENFADGKNPGRKGLAKRMGVPTKASVTRLRQIAKSSSGEKQRMAHWMANMKSGKRK